MARKSKKKLFEALDEFFNTDHYTTNQLNAVGDETYGRDSRIYIDSSGKRAELESFLRQRDFMVNSRYAPTSDVVEVGVSYFKGHHWEV